VAEQLGSMADEIQAPAQEVSGRAHEGGVDVGLGDHPSSQESGDLVGIDLVVLGLASVDSLHVEGVAEDEGDPFRGAEVSEPVPGENALHSHDNVVSVRSEKIEEDLGIGLDVSLEEDFAGLVEDDDVQTTYMVLA